MRTRSAVLVGVLALFALGMGTSEPSRPAGPAPSWYLALGDSLAQGVQPVGPGGTDVATNQGYVDTLYTSLRPGRPGLRLVKLGCSGETTTTMIKGGICSYRAGSQLAAATTFLRAHRGRVRLVTIDIGANNVDGCFSASGINRACLQRGFTTTATQLPVIMRALRVAAGPSTRIVAMNYYDPFLAAWLLGGRGQQLARESVPLTDAFNSVISAAQRVERVPVADVAGAFHTSSFRPTATGLPRNVTTVCQWTWMCTVPPGPDIHATRVGYAAIAAAFRAALPALPR